MATLLETKTGAPREQDAQPKRKQTDCIMDLPHLLVNPAAIRCLAPLQLPRAERIRQRFVLRLTGCVAELRELRGHWRKAA